MRISPSLLETCLTRHYKRQYQRVRNLKLLTIESPIHLKAAASLTRIIKLSAVMDIDRFETQLMPLFARYTSNPSSAELIGSYFESYPDHFNRFDGIVVQAASNASVLRMLVERTYSNEEVSSQFKSEKLESAVLDLLHKVLESGNPDDLQHAIGIVDLLSVKREGIYF